MGERKAQDIRCEIEILKDGKNFRDIVKRFHGGKEGEARFRAVLEKLNQEFFWGHYVIAKRIGKTRSTVKRWFKRLGIEPLAIKPIEDFAVLGCVEKPPYPDVFSGKPIKRVHTIIPDESLSYFLFFVLGDGTVDHYHIRAYNKEKALHDPLLRIMQKYGTITRLYFLNKKRVESLEESNLWMLQLSSAKYASLLSPLGDNRRKTIDLILNDPNLMAQAIAGLWDADGSVTPPLHRVEAKIVLTNCDKDLLDRVKRSLAVFNINSYYGKPTPTGRVSRINGRPVVTKRNIWPLYISMSDFTRWINVIGKHLKHPHKAETAKTILKSYK